MKQIVKIEINGQDIETLKATINSYGHIEIMRTIGNFMILASSEGFTKFEEETGISTYAPF